MKRLLAGTALAVFGLAPAMGSACDYTDDSAASAAPTTQMASASPSAASKVRATASAKALAPKTSKAMADKTKAIPADQKLAGIAKD